MRNPLLIVAYLCALLITVAHAAAEEEHVGRLYRIDIKAEHPKAYHPTVGDLVKCYIDFPIVPEQIVDDLRVSVEGNSVYLVAVVSTSNPKIIGSGQVSAFLVPRVPGLSHVTITVNIPGQKPKTYKMSFLVELERHR
jgi:hypothetical protein